MAENNENNIRNFSIIAHIDHGKSTLADRLLEVTGTVEKRKMREQVLDSMELERERGITIKMQPVRMAYTHDGIEYVINLIDTPGHIDFSYEVSRALKAVEGSILLVDATQGVQAQTLSTLQMAQNLGLVIIPVLSKIDSPLARSSEVKEEMCVLLGCKTEDIVETSGKTGEGAENLLAQIIKRIPPPKNVSTKDKENAFTSLVFDFQYSNHTGVIVYVRVMEGKVRRHDNLIFKIAEKTFSALEVGTFSPDETPREELCAGEIGYIVTGIKEPGIVSVGDTIANKNNTAEALPGYKTPRPVVWSSLYPESQDDFPLLRQALTRLKLSDSSVSFEEEGSGLLGKGFKCGFLGMLHLEIVSERLHREFGLNLVITTPTIYYDVVLKSNKKKETIYSPAFFPEESLIASAEEPWVKLTVITPSSYMSQIMQLLFDHEAVIGNTTAFGDNRLSLEAEMPLRELMRNFFNKIKSVSSGYASFSYEMTGMRPADIAKLEILVAEEPVPAFARIVSRKTVEREAEDTVEKLYKILPQQMFATKVQGKALGRIVSSRTIPALKKNVTQHMYGGDRTRKMKLWAKQKEGKKRMKAEGKVNIPHDVFIKMMQAE
jgi:GTP-binding protein LepA